jgi:hypothetical protein
MYLPEPIFKLILDLNSASVRIEQTLLCKKVLKYYDDQNLLNGEKINQWRIELKLLIEKALRYEYCTGVLCTDSEFRQAYDAHGGALRNEIQFAQMNWLDSLVTSVWYKCIFLNISVFFNFCML